MTDRWHRWLLDVRFGGDAAIREKQLTGFLYPVRDAVLGKAGLAPGDRSMREFYRVLKPAGRASLFEPINVLMSSADPDRFFGYDVAPVRPLAARVTALYESIQPPGADPMVDFDDRDLVRHAQAAGFSRVDLELQVSVRTSKNPEPWELFIRASGNPLIPTLAEAMSQVLSPPEVAELTTHLRPLVESGTGLERRALAYLTAVKN